MLDVVIRKKSFGKNIIFDNTELKISAPGIYLLKGKNGSGKSTLLKIILGKETFDGDLILNKNLIKKEEAVNYVEFIDQRNYFISVYDSDENENINKIEKGNYKRKYKSKFKTKKQLSLGERISCTLKAYKESKKSIILLDEITSHLDNKNFTNIVKELIDISKTKIVIIATHDNRFDDYDFDEIKISNHKIEYKITKLENINFYHQEQIHKKAYLYFFKKIFKNKFLLNSLISIFVGAIFSVTIAIGEWLFFDVKKEFNSTIEKIDNLIVEKAKGSDSFSLLEFEEYSDKYKTVKAKFDEFNIENNESLYAEIDSSNEKLFINGNTTLIPGAKINIEYKLKNKINKIPSSILRNPANYEYLIENKFVYEDNFNDYKIDSDALDFYKIIIPFSRYKEEFSSSSILNLSDDEIIFNSCLASINFLDNIDYDFSFKEVFKEEVKVIKDSEIPVYIVVISDTNFSNLILRKSFINSFRISKNKNNEKVIKDNLYKYNNDIYVHNLSNSISTLYINEMTSKSIKESYLSFIFLGVTSLILSIVIVLINFRFLLNSRKNDLEIIENRNYKKKIIVGFQLLESAFYIFFAIIIGNFLNGIDWHRLMYKTTSIFHFNFYVMIFEIVFLFILISFEFLYLKLCYLQNHDKYHE